MAFTPDPPRPAGASDGFSQGATILLRQNAPVVVLDANTGRRWPIRVEIYVVALRHLRTAAGERVEAPAAFRYYRDRAPSKIARRVKGSFEMPAASSLPRSPVARLRRDVPRSTALASSAVPPRWGRARSAASVRSTGSSSARPTRSACDFTRASLGAPAMNYSVLLPRSVDFDQFAQVLYPSCPATIVAEAPATQAASAGHGRVC